VGGSYDFFSSFGHVPLSLAGPPATKKPTLGESFKQNHSKWHSDVTAVGKHLALTK